MRMNLPHIDREGVVGAAEKKFRRSIPKMKQVKEGGEKMK